MKVFVTVGTTEFETLVQKVCSPEIQRCLQNRGYTCMLIQAGKTKPEAQDGVMATTWYDYKPSIKEDMAAADLIISHAGAGTCLEALGLNKELVVVINDSLMGNHQVELAEKLADEGYLQYATLSTLEPVLSSLPSHQRKAFPKPNPQLFSNFLMKTLDLKR
eukprot:TRINITY_DN18117_c0_g1_i1.p1 TRINITY_DN18117_c0_g1~~TRINITY_DN18117_c0_g1_i1.p1  ORF type:complete len:172 (-),score=10.76 TRINITY_DN18117_c0_g1_i1:97-582(-)